MGKRKRLPGPQPLRSARNAKHRKIGYSERRTNMATGVTTTSQNLSPIQRCPTQPSGSNKSYARRSVAGESVMRAQIIHASENEQHNMPQGRSARFFTLRTLIRIAFTVLSLSGAAHAQSANKAEPRKTCGNCNFLAAAADPLDLALRGGRQSTGDSVRDFRHLARARVRPPVATLNAAIPIILLPKPPDYETELQPLSLL
jgi:hypothetical protein